MSRRHDIRRVRSHRSYSTAELMRCLRVTAGTVSRWRGQGLTEIAGIYPYVYEGEHLRGFLKLKNKPRIPTGPGELFCIACKLVRRPAGGGVSLEPRTSTSADLVGRCPHCRRTMYQRVRVTDLAHKLGDLVLRHEGETTPIAGDQPAPHTAGVEGEVT